MTKFNRLTIAIILAFFLNPLFSFAQISSESFSITMTPSSPQPNQMVSASVSTSEFNIDLSKISWSVDNKVMKSGQGEKSFTFRSPAAGKTLELSVTVTPPGRSASTSTIEISPGGTLDIIWETTDGYTPPFYRGKTLPIKQSTIKVVAMPNVKSSSGTYLKPGNFAFNWRKNSSNIPSQSGLGKNSLVFIDEILESSHNIDVSATDGIETVGSSATITFFSPEIIFYEYDQAKGTAKYQKALGATNTISQPRITIVAEPYFLAKNWATNDGTILNWKINGQGAKAGEKNTLGIITNKGQISVEANYDETTRLFRDINSSIKLIVN